MEKERIAWIDVARGFAILFVVLGHSIGYLDDEVNQFVLSFHMPLFFFLSGLCASEPKIGFFSYLKKKAKALLIPQITLGAVNCACFAVFGELSAEQALDNFLYWFLLVLFYVSILFYGLSKIGLRKPVVGAGVLVALLTAIILLDAFPISTPIRVELVPMAMLFYLAGFALKPALTNAERAGTAPIDRLWLLGIPLTAVVSYWNGPVNMSKNSYGDLPLFLLGAAAGIAFVCGLSRNLKSNGFLAWYGRNSIIIYVLHFRVLDALHLVGKMLSEQIAQLNQYRYPANLHYFLICILLFVPIVYVCERWLPFFFGKKPVRRGKLPLKTN